VTAGQALATVSTTALQADSMPHRPRSPAPRRSCRPTNRQAHRRPRSTRTRRRSPLPVAVDVGPDLVRRCHLDVDHRRTVASVDLTVGQQSRAAAAARRLGCERLLRGERVLRASGATGRRNLGSGTGSTSSASSSSTSSSGTSGQIVVVSTSSYIVSATVDDTEVSQIAAATRRSSRPVGDHAGLRHSEHGRIIASESSGVASFPVTIAITGSPSGLYRRHRHRRHHCQAAERRRGGPTTAITYSSSGNATVQVQKNGQTTTRAVTVGQSASGETQITAGSSPVIACSNGLSNQRRSGTHLRLGWLPGGGGFGGGGSPVAAG